MIVPFITIFATVYSFIVLLFRTVESDDYERKPDIFWGALVLVGGLNFLISNDGYLNAYVVSILTDPENGTASHGFLQTLTSVGLGVCSLIFGWDGSVEVSRQRFVKASVYYLCSTILGALSIAFWIYP